MLECHGCGYSIEQPKLDGVCPECGLSVAVSLAAVKQPLAERRFRRRFVPGAFVLAVALVLTAVGVLRLVVVLAEPTAAESSPIWVGAISTTMSTMTYVLPVPSALAMWFAATSPRKAGGRRWAGLAAFATLMAWFALGVVDRLGGPATFGLGGIASWWIWCMRAHGATGWLFLILLCVHLRRVTSLSVEPQVWLRRSLTVTLVLLWIATLATIVPSIISQVAGSDSAFHFLIFELGWGPLVRALLLLPVAVMCVLVARMVNRAAATRPR